VTLFQGTLKIIASKHKCVNKFPLKIKKNFFLGHFYATKFVFKDWEFVTKYSIFRKFCCHLANLHPKGNY